MTERSYLESVVQAERGHLALLLLLNAPTQEEAKKTVVSAWGTIQGFGSAKRSVFFHHFAERRQWVESLLGHGSSSATGGEAWISGVMASGESLVSVIAIFGARKQFCVFPDLDVQTPKRARPHSGLLGSETLHSNGLLDQQQEEAESVSFVLGAVLGLGPDESGSESSSMSEPACDGEEHAKTQDKQWDEGSGRDCSSNFAGHHHDDQTEVDNSGLVRRRSCLVPASLDMWMERLADGSLLRYSVDRWPKWEA